MVNASALGSTALWGAVIAGGVSLVPLAERRVRIVVLRVSAALAVASCVVLVSALLVGDYSIAYVVQTTSRSTPWPYRLAALWGGMDGSMLFYAAVTLGVGAWAVGRVDRRGVSAAGIGLVGTGFLLITALAANPFATLDVPAVDGQGLLAILQHPAMIYHPPILYLGLASLIVPFAFTIESLLGRDTGSSWIAIVRRWLLISWTLLTFGMVAGANWAYVELGWGGFWAWDPVENTALMPWLAATVFIHTSRIQQRDGRMRKWNAFFAMLPFALSVLGVYLTRSGVTGSIHSFAEDPVVGRILLTAAIVALVVSALVPFRGWKGSPWPELGTGRDSWLLASGGLVAAALVFVTVGTAYPAYAQVFFDEAVTVDSRFFVTTVYPIALVVGVLTSFALETRWSKSDLNRRDLGLWIVLFMIAGVVGMLMFDDRLAPLLLIAVGGAGLVALGWKIINGAGRSGKLAGYLAHLGLMMVLIGAGGSPLGDEFRGVMAPGESIDVGERQIRLVDVSTGEEGRIIFARAVFEVDLAISLAPEIRAYEDQPQPISEPDMHSTPARDVIIAISRLSPDAETVSVSVFVRPMVWWVWAGALTTAVAGLVGLFGRFGAAAGRHRSATAGQLPGGTTTDTFAR